MNARGRVQIGTDWARVVGQPDINFFAAGIENPFPSLIKHPQLVLQPIAVAGIQRVALRTGPGHVRCQRDIGCAARCRHRVPSQIPGEVLGINLRAHQITRGDRCGQGPRLKQHRLRCAWVRGEIELRHRGATGDLQEPIGAKFENAAACIGIARALKTCAFVNQLGDGWGISHPHHICATDQAGGHISHIDVAAVLAPGKMANVGRRPDEGRSIR